MFFFLLDRRVDGGDDMRLANPKSLQK